MSVRLARVYDARTPADGRRLLVDRLWPRGVRKTDPRVDAWLKDVAPSNELRRWYGHDPVRAAEFRARYLAELTADGPAARALEGLRSEAAARPVTLVTATREVAGSHLPVLAEVLDGPAPA